MWYIIGATCWLTLGALGAERFRRRVNRRFHMLPPDTWNDRYYWGLTLFGPITLIPDRLF